jgi:hypothetical protein
MAIGDCTVTLNQYDGDIGDKIRITATFVNSADVATDPTTTTIIARDPSDNEASLSVTSTVVGTHWAEVSIDESGTWWFRAKGTGAIEAAQERPFVVRASAFDSP